MQLEPAAGRFQVNPDRVLTIKVGSDAASASDSSRQQHGSGGSHPAITKLIVEPTGDPSFDLLPISETTFVRRDANIKYELVRNATGAVDTIRVVTPGGANEAKRIAADTLVPSELLLAGRLPEAIEGYRKIKREQPANVSVDESRLNNLGYVLMRQKKLPKPSRFLSSMWSSIRHRPMSTTVWVSLHENGDKELGMQTIKVVKAESTLC